MLPDSQPNRKDSAASAALEEGVPWVELQALAHRDPGGRGLASFRRAGLPLDDGAIRAAAVQLAQHGRAVAIITGFPVVLERRVTAETDGPPGALYLALVCQSLGMQTAIVADGSAAEIVRAGARRMGLASELVQVCPQAGDAQCEAWLSEFLRNAPWTHLVAIERPGPSHTVDSFLKQRPMASIPLETFQAALPEADRDRCHTMRGEILDPHVAPTHRLLELAGSREPRLTTIAIGDGGNELGMGCFRWEDLVEAIATGPAGKIACRVPADLGILAGTSNWGAYALALAVARLRRERLTSPWLTADGQQQVLEALVAAGAVDGRTRRAEPTVDGLPGGDYLGTLTAMRRLLD